MTLSRRAGSILKGEDMGPYCRFCNRRCFVHLTIDVPVKILEAYYPNTIIATCPKGQEFEKSSFGYCFADVRQSLDRQDAQYAR